MDRGVTSTRNDNHISQQILNAAREWSKLVGEAPSQRRGRILSVSIPFAGSGSVQPTTPSLSASPSSLEFTGEKDGSAPSAKTVTISISSGSISGLSASENAGWLTTSVSGGKITNEVSLSGLEAKSYTSTVEVTASGADPTSYTVKLTVMETQVFTSITITPSNPTVTPGSTTQFTATAKDQNGNDMADQPDFSWNASGAGTISSSGVFTAGSEEGSATVKATSGGKSASTAVSIEEAPPVALKINCGGGATGGWSPDQYGSGGSTFDFGGTCDVSNVENPAPAEVYATVRHKDPTYTFPASVVPNGTYTLRLHFSDGRGAEGDRLMRVTVEGNEVLSDYDIVAKAGGQYIAVIEEFTVSVTDGDGMTVAIDKGSGNDGFVSGIEVNGGEQMPVRSAPAPSYAAGARKVQVHTGNGVPLQVGVQLDEHHRLSMVNAQGATVATRTGHHAATYRFSDITAPGLYLLRVISRSCRYARVVVIEE